MTKPQVFVIPVACDLSASGVESANPAHSLLQVRWVPGAVQEGVPKRNRSCRPGKLFGMTSDFRDIDPRELRSARRSGADPIKLHRQIARFGASSAGNWRPVAMIPATQREALAVLAEVCELSPDVRLGQLLAHLGFLGV